MVFRQTMGGGEKLTSDDALLASIAANDNEAVKQFIQRYAKPLVQFAYSFIKDVDTCHDIAQETFYRVWQHAHRWHTDKVSVKTWVFRITYHLCIDEIRKRKAFTQSCVDIKHATEQYTDNLEHNFDQQSFYQQVLTQLATLPEQQRIAITLKAMANLKQKEIAYVMGLSEEAIESLIARGRRKLKQQLPEDST